MRRFKIPKQFTVKRSKWLRGEGLVHSYLLREEDGKMCCVGFLTKECGFTDKDILCKQALDQLLDEIRNREADSEECTDLTALGRLEHFISSKGIYDRNDDESIMDSSREKRLIKSFKAFGITLTFED